VRASDRIRCIVTLRQFAIADCVLAAALIAIALLHEGRGAALLIAGTLILGHLGAWYSLRDGRR
jgi:hypothetical protein